MTFGCVRGKFFESNIARGRDKTTWVSDAEGRIQILSQKRRYVRCFREKKADPVTLVRAVAMAFDPEGILFHQVPLLTCCRKSGGDPWWQPGCAIQCVC